ncbi:ABC transporter substrate-binding protein [Archangium lansingense]|uniref:ABC transporter substrate-binding protein n=1 Tax=Archangium lansingense TaxID=2995310 RepID=UPI003B82BA31
MRVAFLNMLAPSNPMQRSLAGVMEAAAHDLGIQLDQYNAAYWPGENLELLRRLVNGSQKPNYLIISMHRGIGVQILEIAEQAQVPVFVIITGLTSEEQTRFGGPRQHFKSWLGQMVPDDTAAGHRLAHLLRDAAHGQQPGPPEGRKGLVALKGRSDDYAVKRSEGLNRALAELSDVEFLQGVYVIVWDPAMAQRRVSLLLRRYPELQLVWASNDVMALGAVQALEEAGRRPGVDVMVGGIGWTPQALQAVREGKLVTSLGGQLLQGAWALVLLYDYHHGKDFAAERLDWRTEMVAITRGNVDEHLRLLGDPSWKKIDFRAFSKVANPTLKHYDFSLQALFKQLHSPAAPP